MTFLKSTIYFVLCFLWFGLNAQIQLRPLSSNHVLNTAKQAVNNYAQKTASVTPLELPIFDDFSYAYKSPYPSNKIWADQYVYVNGGYAIAPLNYGVATFDGLNENGYPYSLNAPVSNSEQADYLTSLPINLKKSGAYVYDSTSHVFLSFYYQAEGNGDAPESKDSLCVDFFNPKDTVWKRVWAKPGYNPSEPDTNFHFVKIAVVDSFYFDSLFQFRFRNKATLSGSLDHWHIDHVYMKKDFVADDTLRGDVSMVYKPSSFLKNYSAMPYKQYNVAERATKLYNFFRSNFSDPNNPRQAAYKYRIYKDDVFLQEEDLNQFVGGAPPFVTDGYYSGIQAHSTITVTPFAPTMTTATTFMFEHVTSCTSSTLTANDTVIHRLRFADYYSYDDGSAEIGIYLNQYAAKLAVKYTLNTADTLRSMRIYFDPITDNGLIQASSFRLMVWSDGGNGPGTVVYKDSLMYPSYLSGCHNLMPSYNLKSCLPLSAGTYYFGIQQTTNQPLNVGFDRNNNHEGTMYYQTGDFWEPSVLKGSIMINPVMGCSLPVEFVDCNTQYVGVEETVVENNKGLSIYPNPTQNNVTVKWTSTSYDNAVVEIKNNLGETVKSSAVENGQTIDVSHLTNGIYFISVNSKQLNVSPQKLIIAR